MQHGPPMPFHGGQPQGSSNYPSLLTRLERQARARAEMARQQQQMVQQQQQPPWGVTFPVAGWNPSHGLSMNPAVVQRTPEYFQVGVPEIELVPPSK